MKTNRYHTPVCDKARINTTPSLRYVSRVFLHGRSSLLRDAGAPQNISVDELKQLPYPKLTRLWKEYVDEMRAALDQAAGDETSVAGKRVVSLIEELRMVLTCLMSANPLGMQSLRCDFVFGNVCGISSCEQCEWCPLPWQSYMSLINRPEHQNRQTTSPPGAC